MEKTFYKILISTLSCLVGVVSFFSSVAVNRVIKMADDVTEIKVSQGKMLTKYEDLERRLAKIEN